MCSRESSIWQPQASMQNGSAWSHSLAVCCSSTHFYFSSLGVTLCPHLINLARRCSTNSTHYTHVICSFFHPLSHFLLSSSCLSQATAFGPCVSLSLGSFCIARMQYLCLLSFQRSLDPFLAAVGSVLWSKKRK